MSSYLNLGLPGPHSSLRDSCEMVGCLVVTLEQRFDVSQDDEYFEPGHGLEKAGCSLELVGDC